MRYPLGAQATLPHDTCGSPDSWAPESNHLARNLAYRYPGFVCDRVPEGVVVLDADYQARAEEIVRERPLLTRARLAGLLNQTLVLNAMVRRPE